MFSVIIPLYNKGELIKRSIDSVLSQTVQDFEIVVVDDGSKDDSATFVKAYSDDRVKYYHKANGGVSSARNYGIKRASYDWIVFLDADDELLPNALGAFREMIQKYNSVKTVIGKNLWVGNRKNIDSQLKEASLSPYRTSYSNNPLLHLWLKRFYSAPRNTAIHKSLLAGKGFDERMSFYEDYEFALRMLSNGSIVYTTEPVAVYIQDGEGLSCSSHPIEKEMAYYIPEQVGSASFWHKALLYENLEMEILWWRQRGNEEYASFYRDMQKQYFGRIYQFLHWLRQKMIRRGWI